MCRPPRAWKRGAGAWASAFGAVLATAAPALAHDGAHPSGLAERGGPSLPPALERAVGNDVRELPNGLLRVETSRGPDLLTHGPDPRSALTSEIDPAARGLPPGVGFFPGDVERAPTCASDYHQHVLYARPPGAPDRLVSVRGQLRAAIRRMNAVLNAESIASGGPTADYRVRCEAGGEVAVDSFVASGASFGQIVSAARAAGFDSTQADYTIFFDGRAGGSCGIGSYADDERPTAANLNNEGGDYAIAYAPCWFTETPMHENGHNMGAVQYSSPNSTGSGGHCHEESDVMCYSPDGGDRHQGGTVERCGSAAPRFDCNFDDYFDTAPEPGEYLERSWNLGSPLNRFIALGDAAPVPGGGGTAGIGGALDDVVAGLLGAGSESGSRAGVTAAPGGWRMYRIRVPRRASVLRVGLDGGEGAQLGLHLRRGSRPTESAFACRDLAATPSMGCRVVDPRRGRWYAGVLTRSGAEGAPFAIGAKVRRRD